MKTKIVNQIKRLEAERDITVLLACETGSRAWGFPSPDSDYDVRLIYMHRKNWYLSLSPKRDHIHVMFDNKLIDISAWDLRKSLHLLYRSNAALLERIQSPTTYMYQPKFKAELEALADDFYAPIAVMYHYLSLAKKMMYEIHLTESNFNLKKLFYALRSSLVCKWVLEKKHRPPISIFDLLKELEIPNSILERIYELIEVKTSKKEAYYHPKVPEILAYIDGVIENSTKYVGNLSGAKNKSQKLDDFFLRWLNTCDLKESAIIAE